MKFKIYCINLYERPDRYEFMKNEFKKYNLNVKFIRNNKHKLGGRYGCFDSHIQCLKDANKNKLDTCLIFEDDIELNPNINELIKNCLNFIQNNNVDILYGSGYTCYINKLYTNNIYSGKSFAAACIFLSKKSIKKILKIYKKIINTNLHYDHLLLMYLKNSFICINTLSKFKPYGSDNDKWSNNIYTILTQKLLNYTSFHINFKDLILKKIFLLLIKFDLNNIKNNLINKIKIINDDKFDKDMNFLVK